MRCYREGEGGGCGGLGAGAGGLGVDVGGLGGDGCRCGCRWTGGGTGVGIDIDVMLWHHNKGASKVLCWEGMVWVPIVIAKNVILALEAVRKSS